MTITQTVEVPADRRLVIEVPREIPAGPTILTFTSTETVRKKMTESEELEFINKNAKRLNKEALDVLSYQTPEDGRAGGELDS